MLYNNILETVGKTPLIQLNKIVADLPCKVYAKVESYNPGLSAKDRVAAYIIDKAEKSGQLKPGATLIEATSGNTGYSLAMIAALKGYQCVLTVSSKISDEKVLGLKALGAQIIICPKEAKPDDPRSYYSQAKRLAKEIPNAYYVNQNFNTQNMDAHYYSTGPEIWEDSKGKVTHYIASTGTGGTLCGTGRYLKEQNEDVNIIAIDAYGSVLKKYYETGIYDEREIYSYRIEGTGKNIIPANIDFDIIDQYIKVTDKHAALRARELARKEGILAGYSTGAVLQGLFQIKENLTKDDFVVVLVSDHGSRYLGKIYNDEWMKNEFPNKINESKPVKVNA